MPLSLITVYDTSLLLDDLYQTGTTTMSSR